MKRADATPEHRRAFQQRCLEALRAEFDRTNGGLWNYRQVESLALRGSYPDTELVVTFHEQDGRRGEEAYDLWHEDPPGDVLDPEEAVQTASIIAINVAGM
jgi:hypothetical protein